MKCCLGTAAAGLALLVALTSGQASDTRYLTQVTLPSDQALAPLGVRKLWHSVVPTAGALDYLTKLQLHGDLLIAQTDGGGLTALDAETGRALWTTRFYGVSAGASVPAGANSSHIIVIADGKMQALNRRTGAREWVINVPHLPATSVVATDQYAYYTATNGEVVSFRVPASAETLRNADWGNLSSTRLLTKPEWAWGMRLTTALSQEPVVVNGRLLIPQREGNIVSMHLDKATVADRFQKMGTIAAPVAVADNDIYFGSLTGQVHCVEVVKEGILQRWRFSCQGRVVAKPLPAGDHLYVASEDGTLVCLNRRTGEQLWKRNNVKSLVSATKRILVAVDRQGQLVAFDRTYGLPLGQWNSSQYSLPMHNAETDRAFIANGNGVIVAMRDVTPAHNRPIVHFPPKPERWMDSAPVAVEPESRPAAKPADAAAPPGKGGAEKAQPGDIQAAPKVSKK